MKGYKSKSFYGVNIKEDPNCPPGMMYFINEKNLEFHSIDAQSRWQRIKDWFKSLL